MTLVITANIFFILMVEHSQWSPWREKNKYQCRRHWKLENLGSRERTERGRAQVSWELSRSWEPEFRWQYGCWLPSDSWTLAGGGNRKCHWPEGSWKGITAARHSSLYGQAQAEMSSWLVRPRVWEKKGAPRKKRLPQETWRSSPYNVAQIKFLNNTALCTTIAHSTCAKILAPWARQPDYGGRKITPRSQYFRRWGKRKTSRTQDSKRPQEPGDNISHRDRRHFPRELSPP